MLNMYVQPYFKHFLFVVTRHKIQGGCIRCHFKRVTFNIYVFLRNSRSYSSEVSGFSNFYTVGPVILNSYGTCCLLVYKRRKY